MTIKILLTAVGIALLSASPIQAQTTGSSFDSLSPGGQKIANALYSAQSTTGTPLTRDQIADLKKTEGWGKVFKQMKADGRIQAKNLGQVVSGYQHQQHAARSTTAGASTRRTTATTSTRRGHATMTRASSRMHAGGRSFATSRHAAGGFGHGGMGGGFGHGGMGGGFGGGFGHGGMGGGGGGHGGGRGR